MKRNEPWEPATLPLLDEYHAFLSQYYREAWTTYAKGFATFPEKYVVSAQPREVGDGIGDAERSEGPSEVKEKGEKGKGKDKGKEKEKAVEEVEQSDATMKSATPRKVRPRRNISREVISDSDQEDGGASKVESPRSKGVPYVDLKKRAAYEVERNAPQVERVTAPRSTPGSPVARRELSEVAPDPEEFPSNIRPRRTRALSAPVDDEDDDIAELDELPEESPIPKTRASARSRSVPTGQKAATKIDTYVEKNTLPSDVVSRDLLRQRFSC